MYVDGGLPPTRDFVRRHWVPLLETMAAPPQDAKTALQEWAQRRSPELPTYEVVGVEGPPHAPTFAVAVRLAGFEPAVGRGTSKRAAEMAAAARLLEEVGGGTTEDAP
jgi:ribonuclease III